MSLPPRNPPIAPQNKAAIAAHPKALRRATDFLKILLRNEVDYFRKRESEREFERESEASDKEDSLISQLGPKAFITEFQQQLGAYASKQWPFDVPLKDGDTLGWWESLEKHPHA